MKPGVLVVLGVAAVALVVLLPPVGLVLGVVTVVYGVRALRSTRAVPRELLTPDGTPVTVSVAQPGRAPAVLATVLGSAATALGLLVVVVVVAVWPQLRAYSSCRNDTVTTQGSSACQQEFKDAVLKRFGHNP